MVERMTLNKSEELWLVQVKFSNFQVAGAMEEELSIKTCLLDQTHGLFVL